MKYLLFILSFGLVTNFCCAKEIVPVLLWNSNQEAKALPALSALQTVSYKEFKSEYLSQFGTDGLPKNILLFLQDSLSVEDLSSHSKEFEFLSSQMEGSHSLFMPKVESPGFLSSDLHTHGYNLINLEPGDSIAGISLKKDTNNFVVVRMPSTATNPSRSKALLKTVEVMKNVISKIGGLAPFTIMFTGLEASVKTDLLPAQERYRRQTREVSQGEGQSVYASNCTLLYFRGNVIFSITNKNKTSNYNLANKTAEEFDDCQHADQWLVLLFNNFSDDISKLRVRFYFEKINGRHWHIKYVEIEENSVKTPLLPRKSMMWVPLDNSFSCSQQMTFKSNCTEDSCSRYQLEIMGIQIEAFMNNSVPANASFHEAWDCVGFFSIPIWSGLIVTFILVIILGWGMHMLAEIKTMDRFDDPKGKHILVPATAE